MAVSKCLTGIRGLDELTAGGLPRGRPTLVCGGAGCGKTLLAVEFLVRGATQYNEPGVLVVFEESAEDVASNVASLGFELGDLVSRNLLLIDNIHIEPGHRSRVAITIWRAFSCESSAPSNR